MAELHIKKLKCVKKDDVIGRDEASLQVDGVTISGPHTLGKGDAVTLTAKRTFTGSIKVTLVDEDGGKDDVLGSVTITETQAGIGDLLAFFNALPGADYHMTYDVHGS
ncbi:hypothetical protein QRX60_32185 [Amycolatopsis mongoliensis]|uniref:Uncharacterized protein n=1 Tax=Amycolatopsis mongoliensis TaxID=715475 RepID=A0A9Y2NI09_9PSEU|nr:hypothetical protein [Amycolatopsis sp. 4-36]WIX98709.1 hypothetical protein QRX60_32185 [Amycolatopsis sp. 4-36]